MCLTYEEAEKVHQYIIDNVSDLYAPLRRIAADDLVARCESWADIGTSDVSINLTQLLRAFEVPMVGPILDAYEACGFQLPSGVRYADIRTA